MGDPTLRDEYHLAWAGADHPDGPWRHLRVVELRGEEALSRPFWFELDVVHDMAGADVDVHELVGSPVALKMFTRTEPSHRVVHGVITDAVQLELEGSHHAARYRITMRPPWMRAALMRKSIIYLEKTLRQIIEKVLERTSLGAALSKSSAVRPLTASGNLDSYRTPSLTYAWAMEDVSRLDDPTTRPYCVQYDESDIDFVARLLEEEGIAYHFEHSDEECLFVMSDFDLGRIDVSDAAPFGPNILGREVFDWRDGGRLRPRSVHLDDYDWRHPNLELAASLPPASPTSRTSFTPVATTRRPSTGRPSPRRGSSASTPSVPSPPPTGTPASSPPARCFGRSTPWPSSAASTSSPRCTTTASSATSPPRRTQGSPTANSSS